MLYITISYIAPLDMTDNCISTQQWQPRNFTYLPMTKSDRGNKSVQVQNTDTKRALKLRTPLMMTWGIADYVDPQTGESDGKFNISLNFPRDEDDYKSEETDQFLEKLKDFENHIIDDAVKHSDEWFGESLSKEVIKHNYFPFIKYQKNKDTKKFDYSKPPSIRAKVPRYVSGDKFDWKVELYSSANQECLYPCSDPNISPPDLVKKQCRVICYIMCGGLWFGGKGWGVTWKMTAGIVNPSQNASAPKQLPVISEKERQLFGSASVLTSVESHEEETVTKSEPVSTVVDDSDEEEDAEPEPEPEPVKEKPKKKILKKKASA